MIISIANIKGGSGKSTLAVNIANFLGKNYKVLVIDSDPQESINVFANIRVNKELKPVFYNIEKTGESLKNTILENKKYYDFIIVDTGGRDSKELRIAMLQANLLLIPTLPSQFDLIVMIEMLEIVKTCQDYNEDLVTYFVLNKVTTNPFLINEAINSSKEFIEEELKETKNIYLANNFISERLIYKKSISQGLSIFENTDGKAIQEFKNLLNEIKLGDL